MKEKGLGTSRRETCKENIPIADDENPVVLTASEEIAQAVGQNFEETSKGDEAPGDKA